MGAQFKYRFVTEQGTRELTHAEYLKDEELRGMVGIIARRVAGRVRLFLGKTIITYPTAFLDGRPKLREHFELLAKEQYMNPFRFFLPHQGECTDFINDFDNNFTALFAPNRLGKTTVVWIKKLVSSMNCDPSWEIFTEHGVKYREYDHKKDIGVYSYQMSNFVDTIWPSVIRKWTPRYLLGAYAEGGGKDISWRGQPKLDLKDFSVWFKAGSQSQGVFESQAIDEWQWDEQGVQAHFNGANERTRTKDGRHDAGATPHKIKGRPDTGAHGWMCQMWAGKMDKGLRTKFYHAAIEDIPDWIYPKEQKEAAYYQHVVEPKKHGDESGKREGQARYYGLPHYSSGLVIDNFDKKHHLIDPFDIPESWTKYRAVDHGRVNPEAMLNMAVSPEGYKVLYQEYYKAGRDISQNVEGIVNACGNELVPLESIVRLQNGMTRRMMKEVWKSQKFVKTLLDSRSFSKTLDTMDMNLGRYYRICGLTCSKASGQSSELSVPIVNDWFSVDYNKENPFTGEMGHSNCYVFRTLSNFIAEIVEWIYEEYQSSTMDDNHNPKESPRKKNDHLMTCLLYLAGCDPRYIEGACDLDIWDEDENKKVKKRVRDKYTGY